MAITPKALEFLSENHFRDSREWYEEHKSEYREYVVKPLADIVCAAAEPLCKIDPKMICLPKIGGSISRLYRDTRFSKDKTRYRDNAWVVFSRSKKDGYPAYFFDFSPRGFIYGFGYYWISPDSLDIARKLILEDDEDYLAARERLENQSRFSFGGDVYKRTRFPLAEEGKRLWLDHRNYDFIHSSTDFDLLFSDKLAQTLIDGFVSLEPMYRFFMKVEEMRTEREMMKREGTYGYF